MKLPPYVENVLKFLAKKDEKYFGTPYAQAYERMKTELIDESLIAKNPQPVSEEKLKAREQEEILRKLDDILRVKENLTQEDIKTLEAIKSDAAGKKNPAGFRRKNPRLSKGKKPSDFDQDELKRGREVEAEHTDDPSEAMKIAMDHLVEDPQYYTKLAKMEAGACGKMEQENPVQTIEETRTVFQGPFEASALGKALPEKERDKVWRDVDVFVKNMVDASLTHIMGFDLKRSTSPITGAKKLGALEFRKAEGLTKGEIEEDRRMVEKRRYYKLVLTSYFHSLIRRFFYVRRYQVESVTFSLEKKKTWKQLAQFDNREANAEAVKLGMDAIMKGVNMTSLQTWIDGNPKLIAEKYAASKKKWEKMYSGEALKKKEAKEKVKAEIAAKRPEELASGGESAPERVSGREHKALGLTESSSGEEIIELLQGDDKTIAIVQEFLEKNKGSKSAKIAALRTLFKKKED